MIISAAIKIGDAIITMPAPNRHHNILRSINRMYNGGQRDECTYEIETQGFITDRGEFLNRRESMQHALHCGQGTPRRNALIQGGKTVYDGDELYSEDLW